MDTDILTRMKEVAAAESAAARSRWDATWTNTQGVHKGSPWYQTVLPDYVTDEWQTATEMRAQIEADLGRLNDPYQVIKGLRSLEGIGLVECKLNENRTHKTQSKFLWRRKCD
jgi:hypothetical protein